MQLFCPACQAAFAGVARCPRCAGLLLMPQEAAALAHDAVAEGRPALMRLTPVSRVVVGTVLALGLYLALRKLTVGALFALGAEPEEWWLTTDGLGTVFGLQAAAALFGALLSGAGRPKGLPLGVAVGGFCGVLFLGAEILAGVPAGELVLYAQPVILASIGGVAGAVGARVWPPPPDLDMPLPVTGKMSSIQLGIETAKTPERPMAWGRVILGAALMVAGVGLADKVRHTAQKYSGGLLKVESIGQGRFLSWQFATLAVLAGGAAAGAGTGAGLRHGVCAGFLGAFGVVGLVAARGEPTQSVAYWLDWLNMSAAGGLAPGGMAGVAAGVLAASLVGGWLGAALFLPLAPAHMRHRRLKAGD